MSKRRSLTPSMRYTDPDSNKRTFTYVQAVALASIGAGERLRKGATSIRFTTALNLAGGGLIHLSGHSGDWEIQGITPHGQDIANLYEQRRAETPYAGRGER